MSAESLASCRCLEDSVSDSQSDFSKPQRDAKTRPTTQTERIKDMEAYIRELELKFKKIFGHKIKTLGLETVDCPVALRLIMKECTDNFSGWNKQEGKSRQVKSPKDDPILKHVPAKERLLCEGILVDLYVAYGALENLRKEK
ncbi:MAG TPA: hypothetical protein DEB09_04770 [Candidatus Magasanikbacteria bacterium]|nr:hypothetical protein [Candidatus Magasanikbacteria bacterium]